MTVIINRPFSDSSVVVRGGSNPNYFFYFAGDPDAAGTDYPDFALDRRYSQPKTIAKSLLCGDPGDTAEVGFFIVDGTPASPSRRAAPHPGAYLYGWPMDNLGSYVPSGIDYGSGESGGQNPYYGRQGQIYFFIAETPTASARGGGLVFGATKNGQAYCVDRVWLSNTGNLILAGGATDEGVSYPFDPTALDIDRKNSPSTNDLTYDTVTGWGNLSILATDDSDRNAISIRKSSATTTGIDISLDHGTNQLKFARTGGGVFMTMYAGSNRIDVIDTTYVVENNQVGGAAEIYLRNTDNTSGSRIHSIYCDEDELRFRKTNDSFGTPTDLLRIDGNGRIDARGPSPGFRVAGADVIVARKTGWAVATGTATRTTFDTASVTTAQLAERVKALIDDLHATAGHGLIGT